MHQFSNILVVCTGNICRSPMAAALLERELGKEQHAIASAGTHALVGAPADPLAIEVMDEHQIDIRPHRARQLTQAMLAAADLVFALDRSHSRFILQSFPQYYGRVFKLGHWHEGVDVADPYRGPKGAFLRAYAEMEHYVATWKQRLGPQQKSAAARAPTP
jgi:protein-tyrosine phosphatase